MDVSVTATSKIRMIVRLCAIGLLVISSVGASNERVSASSKSSRVEALVRGARVAYHQQRVAAADSLYSRALELDLQAADAWVGRGEIQCQMGNYAQAMEFLNRGLRFDRKNVLGWYYRGNTWTCLSQFDSAIADYNRLIAIDPYHSDAYVSRAFAYQYKGDTVQERLDIARALLMDSTNTKARISMSNVLERSGKWERALTELGKAISHCPKDSIAQLSRAHLIRGTILDGHGLDSLAMDDWTKVTVLTPGVPVTYFYMGRLLWEQEDTSGARERFDQLFYLSAPSDSALVREALEMMPAIEPDADRLLRWKRHGR
ncbi:MAG: tetratricopeptide repeat protein [Candidatus Zixiibacteriota bacterium]